MSGFSFGGFGANANKGTSTGFGFGQSGFGNANQQGFGGFGNTAQQQQPAVNPVSLILQNYKYILQNSANQDDSVFSCVMFNYCPPNLREDFLKDESNRTLYGKYLKENPDPENMVPVVVHGFEGLKARMENQKTLIQSVNKNIEVLSNAITQVRVLVTECDRMARQCNAKQAELEEKLIRVIGKLESKSAKSQIVVTNEAFVETLVKLQRSISLPSSGLQSRLSAVYSALNTYGVTIPEDSVKLEDAENVLKFLQNQETALEKIVTILKQTQKELQMILT
ncbi:hypothetical protein WA556_005264, partial [Blastocystis sp. ATCC 50177/Nand II]